MMNVRPIFLLTVAGLLGGPSLARGAVPVAKATPEATVTVGREAVAAWDELQVTDTKISDDIAAGRLEDIPLQSDVIRVAVAVILRDVQTTDDRTNKRINSAAREILALADRLEAVARSGNRTRAETVYVNLHRYVEFAQKRLAPGRELAQVPSDRHAP